MQCCKYNKNIRKSHSAPPPSHSSPPHIGQYPLNIDTYSPVIGILLSANKKKSAISRNVRPASEELIPHPVQSQLIPGKQSLFTLKKPFSKDILFQIFINAKNTRHIF